MKTMLIQAFERSSFQLGGYTLEGWAKMPLIKRDLEFNWMQFCASQIQKIALHRFIRLRQRYFMTKGNKVRLRYVASSLALAGGVLLAIFGPPVSSFALNIGDEYGLAYIAPAAGDAEMAQSDDADAGDVAGGFAASELQAGISDGIRRAATALRKSDKKPSIREIEVGDGDTMAGLLQEAGLNGNETYQAVKALEEYYDVRKIKSGQKIDVQYRPTKDGDLEFSRLAVKLDPIKQVNVMRKGPEHFEAELEEKELQPRQYAGKAKIETSLYGSAMQAGIPPAVIAEVIRIYSWGVDFQRDIQPGDKIEIFYEGQETADGDFTKYGDVLYANLSVGGRDMPLYRFEMDDGRVDYFGPDGISTRKTLMKTPIDGARISSGFGMRRHPVLGYNKMHKGMDFAAPTGTPIYAAGDGTIEQAGRNGAYGNYIRIRHNSTLKTAYAHLHKIKSGVTSGSRVTQGEVIGYVGTTGRSTGPHLHYEVLMNNAQVNPKSLKLPTGEQLEGKQLARFKDAMGSMYQSYVSLAGKLKFAQAPEDEEEPDDSNKI